MAPWHTIMAICVCIIIYIAYYFLIIILIKLYIIFYIDFSLFAYFNLILPYIFTLFIHSNFYTFLTFLCKPLQPPGGPGPQFENPCFRQHFYPTTVTGLQLNNQTLYMPCKIQLAQKSNTLSPTNIKIHFLQNLQVRWREHTLPTSFPLRFMHRYLLLSAPLIRTRLPKVSVST